MKNEAKSLADLVSRLPELYQPIYGFPEFSVGASRETLDRLESIKQVYDLLSSRLGRPLRVLDLGCAQGYIGLSLASMGASVIGVEMLEENVVVCRRLAEINPEFDIDFVHSRIEEFVPALEPGSFDLVLLLSVIHHVAFHGSPEIAEAIVGKVRSCVPVLLAELAVAEEPLYWASALPRDPVAIFGKADFVRELRRTGTHLSEVKRPLFFVSDRYWYAAGELDAIENVRHGGHRFAKFSFSLSRTYFFSGDRVLKVLAIVGEDAQVNRDEVMREIKFLRGVEGDASYPRILGLDEDGRNIYLLREKIAGELLSEVIDDGRPVDFYLVMRAILTECIKLEKRGLYHQDVRIWNVLMRQDGGYCLIDYGAISAAKHDCFWPGNIHISFLIFVKEMLSAPNILVEPIREFAVTPYGFPGHLSFWLSKLTKLPMASWSFELMLAELEAAFLDPGAAAAVPETARDELSKMLEEAINVLARAQDELAKTVDYGHRATATRIQEESQRISNLHHDMLVLEKKWLDLAQRQDEHASSLSILQEAAMEQRDQGKELLLKVMHAAQQSEQLKKTLSSGQDDIRALHGRVDAAVERLDAIASSLAELDTRLEDQSRNAMLLHEGVTHDLSVIKSHVFRKGFLSRMFVR